MPISPGSNACTAEPTILADGATPSPATMSSLAMTTALDPSECDIDSTPAAGPILVIPSWMGCAREIAAPSEEAQKRFSDRRNTLGEPWSVRRLQPSVGPRNRQGAGVRASPQYFPNGVRAPATTYASVLCANGHE
ncbi:hypothetical protein Psi02_62800 [Planotetraspora silvatica]|uniref:Uncharacterized protein n=1 Tax=Planotetraspora silvatica TaxID=234614 RepID=A0A8J3USK2_9ACTN|nr:hypothetical protein Psi02_62800 [Planotetraspora silvatica]